MQQNQNNQSLFPSSPRTVEESIDRRFALFEFFCTPYNGITRLKKELFMRYEMMWQIIRLLKKLPKAKQLFDHTVEKDMEWFEFYYKTHRDFQTKFEGKYPPPLRALKPSVPDAFANEEFREIREVPIAGYYSNKTLIDMLTYSEWDIMTNQADELLFDCCYSISEVVRKVLPKNFYGKDFDKYRVGGFVSVESEGIDLSGKDLFKGLPKA